MAKKSILQNNPLFKAVTEEQETEQGAAVEETAADQTTGAKIGRPKNEALVRKIDGGKSAQDGLPKEYTRASFIVKVSALEDVRAYAYTKRLSNKDALTEILESFFEEYRSNPDNEPLQRKE